jgi:hypothetical protein
MRSSADIASKPGGSFRAVDANQNSVPLLGIGSFENSIWSIPMMDVVMVALAVAFFAVSIAYVYACEQL